ncbi:hypothetical protein HUJ04_005195 [Dendroctonus ponderosae]|uniref:Exoribonuclease phosphorolytic domain-containing protein n=1 Tax=Dendroctonus ponderosae TaxID=77166 RepID=A0AAR5Q7N7_DENPD|nr:hypothetical protein HUJ04_005195 [Dendroctonus ponderosae]
MDVHSKEFISSNTPELKCEFGALSRSDGSVLFSEGESVIMASIYGPVEATFNKIVIDKASVDCYYRPKAGVPGVQDRLRESVIRNICEIAVAISLYPRTAVLVNVQEMQNRGQLISCAINAVSLACLDSGIDMKFVFGAVSCFLSNNGELSCIPSINEDTVKAMLVFVFNNTTGGIIASHTEGCFSIEQYKIALEMCRKESRNVFKFIKTSLLAADKL